MVTYKYLHLGIKVFVSPNPHRPESTSDLVVTFVPPATQTRNPVSCAYDVPVTLTKTTDSFKYDPFGRRNYKSSSSDTSIFAYDDANLIEETRSLAGIWCMAGR
jgi:hypothetical protein